MHPLCNDIRTVATMLLGPEYLRVSRYRSGRERSTREQHGVASAPGALQGAVFRRPFGGFRPALKHTGLHPTHRQYKATVETFWHMTTAGDNPLRARGDQGDA